MDLGLGPLRALALTLNFDAHGVAVTVTIPGGSPVPGQGLWLTNATEDWPSNSPFHRTEAKRVMVLGRDAYPSVPLKTLILAPERTGEVVKAWRVDGFDRRQADQIGVVVVESPEEMP